MKTDYKPSAAKAIYRDRTSFNHLNYLFHIVSSNQKYCKKYRQFSLQILKVLICIKHMQDINRKQSTEIKILNDLKLVIKLTTN